MHPQRLVAPVKRHGRIPRRTLTTRAVWTLPAVSSVAALNDVMLSLDDEGHIPARAMRDERRAH